MRCTIHPIADSNADHLRSEVLDEADDLASAKFIATQRAHDHYYGTGIKDTETGEVDYGFGFGVEAPENE